VSGQRVKDRRSRARPGRRGGAPRPLGKLLYAALTGHWPGTEQTTLPVHRTAVSTGTSLPRREPGCPAGSMRWPAGNIRPTRLGHRLEDRVKARVLICTLVCDLSWHPRKAWVPLTFTDEHPAPPTTRSPRPAVTRQRDEHGRCYYSFRDFWTTWPP
jgi:hypothetical protein